MPRLTKAQWEQARAEYEIRGISLRDVARKFGVSDTAVRKKAASESWQQGKISHLVEKKVAAIKANMEVAAESSQMPQTFRHTLETVVQERLDADGYIASFGKAIAARGAELAMCAEAEELEALSRAHKNISPPAPKEGTVVNVNQAQGIQTVSPKDALAEIVESAREDHGDG